MTELWGRSAFLPGAFQNVGTAGHGRTVSRPGEKMMKARVAARVLGKHVVMIFVMMFCLSVLVFYLSRMAPGDPLQSFYGDAVQSMSPAELEAARHRLGLDAPVWVQYEKWLFGAVQGDFGISLKYRRPVLEVAGPLVGNTLILGGLAYVLVFALAVALALLCVRYEDSWLDRTLCTAGTVAFYTPAFWLGTMLVLVFSVNLHWLPGSGAYGPGLADDVTDRMRHLILPLAVMVAGHVWYYAGMIRNRLLDEVRRDYVLLARSKGLGRSCVLVRHCLRNVLPGIVGLMAISVPHVLSGTYVAETVFNYPGIGLLSVSSAKYHDYNMLMVMVMLAGFMVIVSSVLAQAVNELIDSRMKSGAQGGA